MAIKKELLDVLACTKCKGELKLEGKSLTCHKCRLRYAVLDGDIPDMILEHAVKF